MIKQILVLATAAFFAVAGNAHADSYTNQDMDSWITTFCENSNSSVEDQKLCARMGFAYQDKVLEADSVYARWTLATNKSAETCEYIAAGIDIYLETSSDKEFWTEIATPERMDDVVLNTIGACDSVSQKLQEMYNKSVKYAEERNRAISRSNDDMLLAAFIGRGLAGPSAGNEDE